MKATIGETKSKQQYRWTVVSSKGHITCPRFFRTKKNGKEYISLTPDERWVKVSIWYEYNTKWGK